MKIKVKSQTWEIKEVDIKPNKSLLKELEKAGYEILHACNTGACWACMCKATKWSEFIDKAGLNEPMFPLAEEEVMTCIATVKPEWDGQIEVEL